MNGFYVVSSIFLYLPGLRGFYLQQGWLFSILSKCICPLPFAGGVCWSIYWQRLHFLHLGGLHDLACTVYMCLCPFAHTVYVCAKAAVAAAAGNGSRVHTPGLFPGL